MKLTQTIEDGAARANELFTRLADSKGNAVKIREKLLNELETELEAVRRLDEEHLFPVLANGSATRGLIETARADHAAVREMIGQLKEMPKDGEAFLPRIAELRQAFHRSLRDERKELLPAVREALGADDSQELAARMAEDRDQQKEIAERRQALDAARERLAAQAAGLAGSGADTGAAVMGTTLDGAAQGFDAARHLPQIAADTLGETTRAFSDLTSRAVASGQRASRDIARCGTPLQAAAIQARLLREMTEVWMDAGSRMMEISMRASQSAFLPRR